MNKNTKTSIFKALAVAALVAAASFGTHAFAMMPTLSLASESNNSVQLSIYGDANSSVTLEYQGSYGNQVAGIIGTTNSSGFFSTTLSQNVYGISAGEQVFVLVNGQQSTSVVWPYAYNNGYSGYGTLSLSQTSVTVGVGQSTTVTSYNGSGSLYVSSNSNSSVATAYVYGNQVTITGVGYGSTTLSICGSGTGCASIYVTTSYSNGYTYPTNTYTYPTNYTYPTTYNYGYNTYSPITLSQSSLYLTAGQSQTVQILGGSNYGGTCGTYSYGCAYPATSSAYLPYGGSYYISSYSNPGVISATISGNSLVVYGTGSGSSTINVCSSNGTGVTGSGCATLYVTVTGYNNYGYNNTYPYNYNQYPYNTYPYNNGTHC